MVGCVIGFIMQIWTVGTVSLLGAVICVITGCIEEKRVYQRMDWTTITVLGGALGFANGLKESGAGEIVAQNAVALLGSNPSPWMVLAVLVGIAAFLGNIMSQTATAAIVTPIGVLIADSLGLDPTTVVIGIVMGSNLSYATPIATPPVTMTLAGGYRFMDYVKVGGLLSVFAYLLTVVLLPFFLPLY